MLPSRYWVDLTTADFARLDLSQAVALQPVAAVEQHGPHLPVSVDAAINAGIVDRAVAMLPADAPVLVLPPLPVGKSNEHIAFPGTLNVSYETLGRLWFDIGESVGRAGIRRIIFFNSHGGQPQLVDIVCRDLRVRLGMLAVACTWFQAVDISDLFPEEELAHGIHAGAVETSVMLHLHPDLVRMDRASDFTPASIAIANGNKVLRTEGRTGFGWQMQDLHPSGAAGNATLADREIGRTIVERAAGALSGLCMEVSAFPAEDFSSLTAYSPGGAIVPDLPRLGNGPRRGAAGGDGT